MTKRSLQNDIGELSEELLDELSSDTRLQLLLEATASDRDHWKERLVESVPRAAHTLQAGGFTRRATVSYMAAQAAVADLYSAVVWYSSIKSIHEYSAHVTLVSDDLPPHPWTLVDGAGPTTLLVQLYITYESYCRFAAEEIGVSFSTWVSPIPDGELLAEVVPDILDEEESDIRKYCDSPEEQELLGIDLPDDPDRVAEERYERLVEAYQTAVSGEKT